MSKKFKLGVIGNPIEHSLSPFIHSRFARQEKINLDYKAHKVDLEKFNSLVSDFFSDHLAKGLNIKLTFKSEAASLDGRITPEAQQSNAVKTNSIKQKKEVHEKISQATVNLKNGIPQMGEMVEEDKEVGVITKVLEKKKTIASSANVNFFDMPNQLLPEK